MTENKMFKFADVIKKDIHIPTISICETPVVLDDKRLQNRLFLIHPNLLDESKLKLPPSPPRFEINSIDDIRQRNIQKYKDDDDDFDLSDDEFSQYSGFPSDDDDDEDLFDEYHLYLDE